MSGRNKHIQDTEILTLDARLVCDHNMTKILECCDNCIGRERKRAHRRKESQKLPGPLSSIPIFGAVNPKNGASLADEPVPPTPTDPVEYQAWERRRIMVFSSTEYVDISTGQCLLPTRITCYCRHHNEKVGFRIQFTARDSTGAPVASVLTNAVMMMDDHKSGKRATPAQPKALDGSASSTTKRAATLKASTSTLKVTKDSQSSVEDDTQQECEDDQDNMDQDDAVKDDPDDNEQETGHRLSQNEFADIELLSGDILAPLATETERTGAKRRVDDNMMMDDIQTQSMMDPQRGPSRRKTSHDITPSIVGSPSPFASAAAFASTTTMDTLSSPSPFMPGSPFANDDQGASFLPSFTHALGSGESFLDQKNIDMFLKSGLSNPTDIGHSAPIRRLSKDTTDHESSMMEFTTLEESASSPPDTFRASTLATVSTMVQQGLHQSSMTPVSQSLATRPPFSISAPTPAYSATATIPSATASNPFSSAGMLASAFSTTFSSPLNTSSSASSITPVPGMSASFLDAAQMQEFQNFKRQSVLQQKQQQLLMQLQQGVQQQQGQQQMESKPVPWSAAPANNKDPFWSMRTAMSQTTNPASSAFIPISTSLTDPDLKSAEGQNGAGVSSLNSTLETSLAPKKRGRPRKTAPSNASEATSPVMSPATPADMPPSPSPPPLAPPSSSSTAAAAAAAHFLLLQQRQQQLLQQNQQQLQQQQKQAILARQKPRVQKLIPSRGSVEGGTEITLLGSGFFPGIIPTFDGVPGVNVQYYGPETIVCRLPPRAFPGTVIVKAPNPLSAITAAAASGSGGAGTGGQNDASSSSDLVKTMTQLFGGSAGAQNNLLLGDDDVGVLFEYEESQGDRDLIALALQVLGMKMNGRVEPPHQVAMRIMGTAAASNAIMGQETGAQAQTAAGIPSSQAQRQLPPQQQQLPQQQQQALLGFGGQRQSLPQPSALQQQQQQQQQHQLQTITTVSQAQSGSLANGSLLGTGMLGFGGFFNSMGGPSSNGG
ncbi:SPT3 Dosage dependent suppressor of Ty-induced promoter mutations-like protein [Haplosporangium sp. Z 767]|nr:SPT3 Dosage dependent suppressor of Ty-induced promoter mutations-like protein [Haplosporangium sp. Z 767]